MAAPVLQFKRGNYASLPALRAGEPALTTDTFDFFVGIDSSSVNNKFFGSHRYWTRETASTGSSVKVVEATSNGSDFIALKSPDNLAGIVTYTLPGTISDGYYLSVNASGQLSWVNLTAAGAAFTGATLNNTTLTGITTFTDTTDNTLGNENTGAVQIDGGVGIAKNLTVKQNLHVGGFSEFVGVVTFRGGTINVGDSNTDNINVAGEFISNLTPNVDNTYDIGISTQKWRDAYFSGIGSFATGAYVDGIRIGITAANEIDTTSGNLTLDSTGGQTIIDDNLSVTGVSTFTGNVTLTGDIAVNGGDVTTSATTFNLVNATATNVNFAGAATGLLMGATTGVGTIRNATISFPNATTVSSGQASLALFNTTSTNINAFGAATALVMGAATGITTVSNNLTVGGDIRINGNDIQASDGNTNITLTSNTLTTFAGDIKVSGNDIQASDGNTNITMTSNTLTEVKGDLQVTGNDIKGSDGVNAINFSGAGNVGISSNLTVTGNLYVNGSTTQVNTTSLTVEDTLVELGLVDGNAPVADLNKDLGLLFNYYTTSAKKSALYWDDSLSRIVLASDATESSSVITAAAYAALEIGSLWVNDCAGQSQVISCTGSERFLENITVDAGTF